MRHHTQRHVFLWQTHIQLLLQLLLPLRRLYNLAYPFLEWAGVFFRSYTLIYIIM